MHQRLAVLAIAALIGAILGARAAPACPAGAWRDPPRASRVLRALASTPDGARLLEPPIGAICFGGARGITPDGAILLDARASDADAAAYVGHLLAHRIEGTPGPPPSDRASCAAWLARARAAEERASALEARLALALGATPGPSEVEARVAEYAARCAREAR
jgi:hypothetical protein